MNPFTTSAGLLLTATLSIAGAAQERGGSARGTLLGWISDSVSRAPVVGAEVVLEARGLIVLSDSTGTFRLTNLASGRQEIVIRRIGYVPVRDTVSLAEGLETVKRYLLTKNPATLDTVRTVETQRAISPLLRAFEERKRMGQGHFIDQEELRKHDGKSIAGLARRVPGVTVLSYRVGDYVASTRGSGHSGGLTREPAPRAEPDDPKSPRACWVSVYMDGVPIYTGGSQQVPDLGRWRVNEFAAVEYHAGSATLPVQFSSIKSSSCGVLLLWSRER